MMVTTRFTRSLGTLIPVPPTGLSGLGCDPNAGPYLNCSPQTDETCPPSGLQMNPLWCDPALNPNPSPNPSPAPGGSLNLAVCDLCWLSKDPSGGCSPGADITKVMGGLTDGISSYFRGGGISSIMGLFQPKLWVCDAPYAIGLAIPPLVALLGVMYITKRRF